jgi:hypothetical protein
MDKAHDGKYDTKFRPEPEPAGPPQTALESVYAQLNNAHSDLIAIRDRISGVLGRSFGEAPSPAAGSAAKPRPVRSGALGTIEDVQDNIRETIADIISQIARLETIA